MRIRHPAARLLAPQKIRKGEINAIAHRLQEIDNWSKAVGFRMGLVGDNGMKVWRYIAYSFQAKGKAAFPSYRHIAKKVNIARSTVAEALARLKRIGALKWIQRPGRVNGRRVQGSNLFTIHMPGAKAHALPLLKRARGSRIVAEVVGSLAENARFPKPFSGSGERTHGAKPLLNNGRLEAALAKMQAVMEEKAERLRREGSIGRITEPA